MCRAKCKVIAFILPVALVVCLSTPAAARWGPGAILGLAALPFHIITHGMRGGVHHHAERALAAHASVESARRAARERSRPVEDASTAPPQPAAAPAASASASVAARPDPRQAPPRAAVATAPAWPIASPSVYEDLLGYVLWPGDYADHLWTHGYGDIMNALLAAASGEQAASLIANGMCSTKASELADGLIAHTRATIGPTDAQAAALDELAGALREAIERGRTAVCAGAGDPMQRMVDGLWTMWDATLLIRPPLEKFYNSLTDAQKEKLAGRAGEALNRACAEPHQDASAAQHLAQALGGEQRPAVQQLQERSAELIKFLAASCPQGSEATPMDRLEAAGDRMNALLYAVMSMSPTLHELNQGRGNRPAAE
jgi:hypothetical protein